MEGVIETREQSAGRFFLKMQLFVGEGVGIWPPISSLEGILITYNGSSRRAKKTCILMYFKACGSDPLHLKLWPSRKPTNS